MTQVVGTVYNGSTAATSHSITVPTGVTSGMVGLFVIGTGSSDATVTTLSRSGSTFTKLDEQNAANTRVAIWTGTGLAAGNTVTLALSSSQAVTVAHYYQDVYTFGTLAAAIRLSSVATSTTGSVTPTSGQKVVVVGVERTTTATTVSGTTSSGGETVTQISYGEGTGSAQASCYIGEFDASAAAARTSTITYSNASANGYAAAILTTGSGGGGTPPPTDPGGSYTTPGAAHNIGKGSGKNHFNLGVGKTSGHVDITENQLEAGYTLPSGSAGGAAYYLTADKTAVRMECPLDGGRTSTNTKYPRVEYRELIAGGSGDADSAMRAAWNGGSGEHYVTGWTKMIKVPPGKPEVVIAQIHGPSDDTVKLKWVGVSSAKMVATYDDGDYATVATGLSLNTWYQWKIQALNGTVRFFWVDMSTAKVTITDAPLVQADGQYFKAGLYSQTANNEVIQSDPVSAGPVILELRDLVCWHTGYPPPATPAGVPTVNAGDDASITVGATWARTASEVANGSAITSRTWKIQSGPTGVGTTIDTDQNLAWTPTVIGTYVLRYSATNATGTGFDDATVVVAAESDPGGGGGTGGGTGGGGATSDYAEKFLDGVAWPVVTKQSTTVSVSTGSALSSALSAATSGQKITLASGSYTGTYTISGKTNVSIVASTVGGATFGSGSQLTIKDCTNVWVEGLNWTTDSAIEAINIRGNSKNIRVTQCTIGPSSAAVSSTDSGQYIYISDTAELVRIDYNLLRNKGTAGNCIKVYGNDAAGQVNKHILIDHNIISGVKPEISNGKEPIRVGVSTMSKSMSYWTVCRNYFFDNLAEPELVSGKAGGGLVYGNTFYRNAGGAVLRHGVDCVMADNYFVDGNSTTASAGLKSGGVRFYDSGHKIEHNYMDGLIGVAVPGYQASLLIDRGDAEGSSTALANHWRVINALVDRNAIVNCVTPIVVWNGSQYSQDPSNVTVSNNLTAGTTQAGPIVFNGSATLSGSPAPSGNVNFASTAAAGMAQDADGIWRKAGYGPRLTYIKQSMVGPGGSTYDTDRAGTTLGGSSGGGGGTGGGGGGGGGGSTGGAVFPMDRLSARWSLNTPEPSPWKAGNWNVYKDGGPIVFDGDNPPGPPNNPDLDTFVRDTNAQRAFKLTTAKDAIIMSVDYNGTTTSGSSNPRMELREMNKDGLDVAVWNTNVGEHKMVVITQVDRLDGNHLVIAQIHGASDDLTVFRVEGTTLWATHGDTAHGANLGTITLGKKIRIAFRTTGGVTQHYYDNDADANSATSIFDSAFLKHSYTASDSGCYFKVGAYLQKQGSSGSWCQVTLPDANIIHTGTSAALNGDDATEDRVIGGGEGGGSGTTVPVVNAGGGATILAGQSFSRTGTETGDAITSRRWSIEAGPVGVGTTLSTTASVSWTPTATGTYVLRYAATNSAGTGTNDATIAVTTGGGGSTTPPAFVAVTSDSGESSTVTAAAPSGLLTGDAQATVILSAGAETIVDPVPAGWTLWDTAAVTSAAGDPGGPCTAWVFTSTSATGPATWTKSGTRKWHVMRGAWRGQAAFGQHQVVAENSAATSHPTPAVTPSRSNSLVIGIVCADRVNSVAGPFTAPSTWTERYDQTVTIGTESLSITLADVVSGSSTTGTFTSTVADESAVFALVLEGPQADQALLLQGIAPTGGAGALAVGFAGPDQTLNLKGIPRSGAVGKLTVTVAPGPITINLKGIPPR